MTFHQSPLPHQFLPRLRCKASSENDAARIKAAEMMMLAPSNPKHQHFAIAAAMKDGDLGERVEERRWCQGCYVYFEDI